MSSSLNRIKKNIIEAMQSTNNQGTSAYDSVAEVRRVEGDTAWVHIAGGVDETPVKLTIAAKAGDVVQVRVGGGRAWITGNASAPPTDDTTAREARWRARSAMLVAHKAQGSAQAAQNTASTAESKADVASTTASKAQSTADNASTKADNAAKSAAAANDSVDSLESQTDKAIVFDTSYTFSTDGTETANFEAHVYRYGEDVTAEYADSCFSWWRKLEGERTSGDMVRFATGKTCTVSLADCGYGATVVGQFETSDDASLLTTSSARLQTLDAVPLTALASGDSVRVSDLPTTTPQSDDWLMGWSAASTYKATMRNVVEASMQVATKSEIEEALA